MNIMNINEDLICLITLQGTYHILPLEEENHLPSYLVLPLKGNKRDMLVS